MNRIVQPELLDQLPPDDPNAVRSRRDLRRVNAWMRNHAIMAGTLKNGLDGDTLENVTDLGAGDGQFLLSTARHLSAWAVSPSGRPDRLKRGLQTEGVQATLLDRQRIASAETLAAFARIGWRAEAVVADVFDWPQAPSQIVLANLFLHHFEDDRLAELLRAVARRAKLFVAVEPRRAAWPSFCCRWIWAIGCNAVTRHDAAVSVRAGFSGCELSALWPHSQHWQLTEHSAGPFSHLFLAKQIP